MYGANKKRSMLRALLPSTRRKHARDMKRIVHKRERAQVRQALHPVFDCSSADDCERDYGVHLTHEIREVMFDRRNGDKLGPFMHWAEAITAHLDDDHDKYAYVASLVGDNLIGRHALTHLPYGWNPADALRWWRSQPAPTKAEREAKYLNYSEALYACCGAAGLQRRLNHVLKRAFVAGHRTWIGRDPVTGLAGYDTTFCANCDAGPRLLMGTGDIEAFIADWHGATVWNRSKRTFWRHGLIVSERTARLYRLRDHVGHPHYVHGPWGALTDFLQNEGLLET